MLTNGNTYFWFLVLHTKNDNENSGQKQNKKNIKNTQIDYQVPGVPKSEHGEGESEKKQDGEL